MRDADAMTRPNASVVVLAVLVFLVSFSQDAMSSTATERPLPGLSVYNISSRWTTQDGDFVRLETLRGRPTVVAMIYLNCPDVCPLIAENMEQIQANLPQALSSKVNFALFTFDSARDTPDKLKAYAKARGLDAKHWTLFQSDDRATRELAAVLDVTYHKKDDGNFDHSVVITLLDGDGVVAYQQIGLRTDTREFEAKIRALNLNNTK